MFSLFKKDDGLCVLDAGLHWQQELLAADTAQQQEEPSFLDRLAAPTVFIQQALLYESALDIDVLRRAIAAVAHCFPPFGYRLTEKDGQLLIVPRSATGTAGIAFMNAPANRSTLTVQQLIKHSIQPTSTTSATAAASHQSSSRSQQVQVPELTDLLFSHLPGSLTPDYVNSNLPLVHVALLQLQGGGSVLGVRMSHLLGDWTSVRLLLKNLATSYSAAARSETKQQQQQHMLPAAPLLNKLVTAVHKQQQQQQSANHNWSPVRLKPLEDADKDKFAKLAALSSSSSSSSSSSQRPVRLSYHVPLDRVQQLKRETAAKAALGAASSSNGGNNGGSIAASGDSDGGSNGGSSSSISWCTGHNVLLASVLKTFGSLAGRQGLPHDVSVAVDMRGRLPSQTLKLITHNDTQQQGQQHQQRQQQQQEQQQQQKQELGLDCLVGNFFASAIAEDCEPEICSRAQLAQALHAAVNRAAGLWLPDLAWAAGVTGLTHPPSTAGNAAASAAETTAGRAAGSAAENAAGTAAGTAETTAGSTAETTAGSRSVTGVSAGDVTWRRLHAMGPKALLQQQVDLGLLPALSATQWPLDLTADANFAGLVPCMAVPSFSQPQPYPLVLIQQATAAQGGGWVVHLFLDPTEADDMQQAVAAQGGL